MKKLALLATSVALVIFSASSWSMRPPAYLSVPDWKSCTESYTEKSAEFYCLPKDRPSACPMSSWKKLKHHHMLNRCPKHAGAGMGSTMPQ